MRTISFRLSLIAPAVFAAAWGFAAIDAAAQSYPSRNITIVVPYSAGGSSDIMARAMGKRLADAWSKNVIIDNRAGASGMIGAALVTKATPDGHTLLVTTSSYPATAATRKKLPFDPATAIIPVAMIAKAPNLLAVHPSVPATTVKELVALAKKNPGKLNYSSSGVGGNNHFSGALFAAAAGIKITHIPYKGIAPAVTALVSGEVDLVVSSAAAVMPQVKAGRVRAIAASSLKPSPLLPGLPAIAQSGVPGYSYELWWGLFAPAGTPDNVVRALNTQVNKILASAEMKKFLDNQGAQPWPLTTAQLNGLLVREIARYKKAAKVAGISPR
ncbi:MAG: tripartite tricarboxylate transporter substrate binding protein [Betaproteobacteria bacterium]|nr:tripartite tricarboxylate transporter substrate binding protein [Betaproteobacteria bacterium]MDH3437824.1 tripartite tricarboxylate transporter substrate binding protein [Betaproteobacteria bacterium]